MFDQVSSGRKKVSPKTTPSPKADFQRVSGDGKAQQRDAGDRGPPLGGRGERAVEGEPPGRRRPGCAARRNRAGHGPSGASPNRDGGRAAGRRRIGRPPAHCPLSVTPPPQDSGWPRCLRSCRPRSGRSGAVVSIRAVSPFRRTGRCRTPPGRRPRWHRVVGSGRPATGRAAAVPGIAGSVDHPGHLLVDDRPDQFTCADDRQVRRGARPRWCRCPRSVRPARPVAAAGVRDQRGPRPRSRSRACGAALRPAGPATGRPG